MAVKKERSCRRFLLRRADSGGPLRAAGSAQQQRCKTAPRHPFAWPRARYVNINHCQPGCYVAEFGAKAVGPELRSDEGSRATRPFSSNAPAQRQGSPSPCLTVVAVSRCGTTPGFCVSHYIVVWGPLGGGGGRRSVIFSALRTSRARPLPGVTPLRSAEST